MGKLILHIFIACSILIFMGLTSCAKKQGNANSGQPKVEKEIDSLHLHPLGRIIEDTIVGPWMLKTIISPNDALVKGGEYTFGDSSVFVTLSYKNHPLFTDKEIRTKDLMDAEGEYQMYYGGGLHWYSDSTIYLSFGCFLPDTDDGWPMLYRIRNNGVCDIINQDFELGIDGFDIVSDFVTLYFCEREVGVAVTDMRLLFQRYCTEQCATKLMNGDIWITSPDTDFRNANKTMVITWETEDGSDITMPQKFNVEWKPNPNDDNVTDGAIFVVDYSVNKISEIEMPYRKII